MATLCAPIAQSALSQQPFTVVIDAGHGGHDYGAVDNGVNEKDINLGVAKKLAALLQKNHKTEIKTVMTRDDDRFITLQERANIANRNKGNLFISIHTNSVDKSNPNRKAVAGASVYALGPQKDANNLKVAQRENSVIELEQNYQQKYSGFDPSKDESYIIFEMAQKKTLGQSLKFADNAQRQLVSTAGRKDRGVKQAGFWVLWATSMPAVLVELDFICNPTAAAYLASDKGQAELAHSLYKAVEGYWKSQDVHAQAASSHSVGADIGENPDEATPAPQPKRTVTKAPELTNNRRSATSRRRRSDTSRKLSEERNVESADIRVLSEGNVAESNVKEKQPGQPENSVEEPKDKKKSKKEKKQKAKKDDKIDKGDTASDKAKPQKAQRRSHRKTFVVKSPKAQDNTGAQSPSAASPDIAASSPSPAATSVNSQRRPESTETASVTRTYHILLLASADELPMDDAAFCGLRPTGKFFENGQHKYIYASSTDRRQIESKLWEVKSIMPDACIIVK